MTNQVKKFAPGATTVPAAPPAPATPEQHPEINLERAQIFVPIMRVDAEKRMIEGRATIEDLDAYGTIFSYEASKNAFVAWEGNIREMHRAEAVGHALEVEFDDEHKQIIVRAIISKGAESTWQKILDGTLRGFSVGARTKKEGWSTIERAGKTVPYLVDYELVELSVVDKPATPGCNFAIIRADGYTDVLAPDSELEMGQQGDQNRDMSYVQNSLHNSRDAIMSACGCDNCNAFLAGSYGRADEPDTTALIQRFDAISADLAMRNVDFTGQFVKLQATLNTVLQRFDTLTTENQALKQKVDRMAAQPQPGGPIRNTNGQSATKPLTEADVLRLAAERGILKTNDQQLEAATALILNKKR